MPSASPPMGSCPKACPHAGLTGKSRPLAALLFGLRQSGPCSGPCHSLRCLRCHAQCASAQEWRASHAGRRHESEPWAAGCAPRHAAAARICMQPARARGAARTSRIAGVETRKSSRSLSRPPTPRRAPESVLDGVDGADVGLLRSLFQHDRMPQSLPVSSCRTQPQAKGG
jgi:hypothetical protein